MERQLQYGFSTPAILLQEAPVPLHWRDMRRPRYPELRQFPRQNYLGLSCFLPGVNRCRVEYSGHPPLQLARHGLAVAYGHSYRLPQR